MSNNLSIDSVSAVNFGHRFSTRIGENIGEMLQEAVDQTSNSISIDDMRKCLRETLESAMRAMEYESVMPDLEALSSSRHDIKVGNVRDIQEVIDELQGPNY